MWSAPSLCGNKHFFSRIADFVIHALRETTFHSSFFLFFLACMLQKQLHSQVNMLNKEINIFQKLFFWCWNKTENIGVIFAKQRQQKNIRAPTSR